MIKVFARALCGCCDVEMQFVDKESARLKLDSLGNGHFDVVDDAGETHSGVDLFYGYSFEEDGMKDRGLGYLMVKAGLIQNE